MKKLTLVFLFFVSVSSVFSDTETIDGITWTYTISNGKASIGCDGQFDTAIPPSTTGKIVIPSTLGGCTVTRIGEDAFYKCSGITTLTIPNGVESIGTSAFHSCSNLTYVKIPGSVASIGDNAFFNCIKLTSATIPNGVTSIGGAAFQNCAKLSLRTIPSSITNIGWRAFAGCNEISSVTIEGDVSIFADSFPNTLLQITFMGDAPSLKCRVDKTIAIEPLKPVTGQIIGPDHTTITVSEPYTGMLSTYLSNCTVYVKPGSMGWRTNIPGWWRELPIRYLEDANPDGGQGGAPVIAATTYTVKFAANGGTGTMAAQKMTVGKAATLRKNDFKRSGCLFLGWAKTKTGAVAYKDGAAVKNLVATGKSVTLYARWAKKTYKAKFCHTYKNETGKMAVQKMAYGKKAKLEANKFKRPGYVFIGWAKSKALAKKGKVAYKNKKTVKNLVANGKTVKLYAVWRKK